MSNVKTVPIPKEGLQNSMVIEVNFVIRQFLKLESSDKQRLLEIIVQASVDSEEFTEAGREIFCLIDSDNDALIAYVNEVFYDGNKIAAGYHVFFSARPERAAFCAQYFRDHLVCEDGDYHIPELDVSELKAA